MKKRSTILLSALALLATASCSSDDEMDANLVPQELTDIRVVAPNFELDQPDSRLSIDLSRGLSTKWTNGDTLGIMPNEGSQAPFPISVKEGEEASVASFTGGGWALLPSTSYSAYFPYIGDIYLDKSNIPVSFLGQWQNSTTDGSYLTPYIYMGSVANTPENGSVKIKMQHLSCLTWFIINVPEPTDFASIKFVADKDVFIHQAKLNMTKPVLNLEPIITADTLKFSLDGVKTTVANEKLNLYFMFGPTHLEGNTIRAILCDKEGYEEEVLIEGRELVAGKARRFADLNYTVFTQHPQPNWTFDEVSNPYQSGMTTVVTVPKSMKKFLAEGDEMSAYVGGQLRGVGKLIKGAFYLMVHGDIGEVGKVSFKYYNKKKQYLYEANDVVDFNSDKVFGVTDEPQELPLLLVK